MNEMTRRPAPGSLTTGGGHSVLGSNPVRIRPEGKIRPGIKVLTAAAKKHPKAQDIYDAGIEAGEGWAEIEKRLRDTCGFNRSPLTPKNTPYFWVKRQDFSSPEVADMILDAFGEDRGDGVHLYRFPVIFPSDSFLTNLPHGLATHRANELVYWSEYDTDGTRRCYEHKPIHFDPKAKRGRRPFGGRPKQLRNDEAIRGGICEPESCPEYQDGKCNLSGILIFYIPGIPGSAPIGLPTTSFYGMEQARTQMELVAQIRGRIAGTEQGKPIFYITKRAEQVSMLDLETGKPKKVRQWITRLESTVDMSKVFARIEAAQQQAAGDQAAALLENRTPQAEPEAITDAAHGIEHQQAYNTEQPDAGDEPAPDDDAVSALQQEIKTALEAMCIDTKRFQAYAVNQWGREWATNVETLTIARDELNHAADDPDAYVKENGLEDDDEGEQE